MAGIMPGGCRLDASGCLVLAWRTCFHQCALHSSTALLWRQWKLCTQAAWCWPGAPPCRTLQPRRSVLDVTTNMSF